MRLIPCALASRMTPANDELIAAVAPPDCPTMSVEGWGRASSPLRAASCRSFWLSSMAPLAPLSLLPKITGMRPALRAARAEAAYHNTELGRGARRSERVDVQIGGGENTSVGATLVVALVG